VQSYTSNASGNPLVTDLDYIVTHTEKIWEELRGKRLFITGGTGFFGSWLLESFAWANKKLDLNASALVLTRNYHIFKKNAPHLAANPAIQFHIGDVRNYTFPEGKFSHIIHAATTSAIATFNNLEDPLAKFDTIGNGTRRTLDFAAQCNAEKFLLTSSGVVYGKQPPDMTHIPEEYQGAPYPLDPNSVVGESKRVAELLCSLYSNKYGITATIARCFVFVGPCLPLDIHYAIGNFIRDALQGGPIRVNGDGTPYRSYLYAADLAVWLWTILFRGSSCRAYNVGSEESVTIADLAHKVAKSFQKPLEVHVAKTPIPGSLPDRYVPSTKRAQHDLDLKQSIDLEAAIKRTIAYHLSIRNHTGSHTGIL
jgi:nucleoside-diphosphate-sugar epimerase